MPPGPSFGDMAFDVYRIVPPGDTIEFMATLDDANGKSIRPELNGTGSGQFRLSRQSPNATVENLAMGNLVKVRLPAVSEDPIFSFFLESGDFDLISRDEEGGEDLHFGGHGGLSYWARAIWLSEVFSIPWWPECADPPHADAKGVVEVQPGTYRFYAVSGTPKVITGFTTLRVSDEFCASFKARQTYKWPSESSKRFLVLILDGAHAGSYFHPHQDGVTEYLSSKSAGFRSGVTLTEVGATPGAVLSYLFDEGTAVDRPVQPIPLMTVDFDDTLDSDSNAWTTSDALAGLSAGIGDYFLETLGQLVGTGAIDMVMGPDLDMHAYNSYGRDLTGADFGTGVVRFQKASDGVVGNIVDALAHEVRDGPIATFAEVQGNDDVFAQAIIADAETFIAREISVSGNSADETALEAIGQDALRLRLARGESLSFPVVVGDDETLGWYTPGPPGSTGHFWLGDTVTLTTGATDEDFIEEPVRVAAITMSESDETGDLDVVVEVRTGPLPVTGSISIDSPDAAAMSTCGDCPCSLGVPIAGSWDDGTDPTAFTWGTPYLTEYFGVVHMGTSDGSGESFGFGFPFAPSTLTVFVDGLQVPPVAAVPLTGDFTLPSGPTGEVYASCRLTCIPDSEPPT